MARAVQKGVLGKKKAGKAARRIAATVPATKVKHFTKRSA